MLHAHHLRARAHMAGTNLDSSLIFTERDRAVHVCPPGSAAFIADRSCCAATSQKLGKSSAADHGQENGKAPFPGLFQ